VNDKRRSLSISAIALAIGFLCGGTSRAADPEWDKMAWIDAKTITLRAGYNTVSQYPHARAFERFAHRVAENTGQNVNIQTFPSEALGDEKKMLEALMLGTLDMAKVSTSNITGFMPEFGVLDLPYIFRDVNHMMKTLRGDVGKELTAKLEQRNLKVLFWMEQGSRSFYTAKKPINTPADLKGMKIRTLPSPIMAATVSALGASAVTMGFGEVYLALNQGVVDGAENAPDAIYYGKHYEVAKYFSLTNQFRTPVVFLMNKAKFDSLPKEYQQIIDASAKDTEDWGATLYSDLTVELEKKLASLGMTINHPDEAPFRAAVQPVYEKSKQFSDLIARIKAVQ
jgi:tripartite ATP-independent transporter DctP family solute receptor